MAQLDNSQKFNGHRDGLYKSSSIYTPSSAASQNLKSMLAQGSEFPHRVSLQKTLDGANSANNRKVEKSSKRHVAFQSSQSPSRVKSMGPGYARGSLVSRYNDVTALDHLVEDYGGTTSTLECLPHRLQMRKKKPKNLKERIEDLTVENGYLQDELAYYKDTRAVLMRFFDNIDESHRMMKGAIYEASKDVAISEQRLLGYWGIYHEDGNVVKNIFF